jgi:hypothetical protein
MSWEDVQKERDAYVADYGRDQGLSMFEQEYLCSFDAAILGSYYALELRDAEQQGRVSIPGLHDPDMPVYCALDLGHNDDTAIWFWQVTKAGVNFIDFYSNCGKKVGHYLEVIEGKGYNISKQIYLPHDGWAESLAAEHTIEQQMRRAGYNPVMAPKASVQDGIQAARKLMETCKFDKATDGGVELLRHYHREWDEKLRTFKQNPCHDFSSHAADGFRYAALSYRKFHDKPKIAAPKWPQESTIDQMIRKAAKLRRELD